MYIKHTAYFIKEKEKRAELYKIVRKIAQETGKSSTIILLDMICCSLVYGAMFTEYDDLDFVYRSARNRNTFITTFFNFKVYDKYNSKPYRMLFHNKISFLDTFGSLINRSWLDITKANDEELTEFISKNDKAVLKASKGDSGKEVEVIDITEDMDAQWMRLYMAKKKYDLIEQCMENHPDIARLNASSLNTIRLVTVRTDNEVRYLFSGIRVGAKGVKIDNISQGGSVAKINIDTGRICSAFFGKKNTYGSPEKTVMEDFSVGGWGIQFLIGLM